MPTAFSNPYQPIPSSLISSACDLRVKIQGTLLKVDEDPIRDKTELVIKVRTTKLEKIGVDAKAFIGRENALTISLED